jgi:hypothetical protein
MAGKLRAQEKNRICSFIFKANPSIAVRLVHRSTMCLAAQVRKTINRALFLTIIHSEIERTTTL